MKRDIDMRNGVRGEVEGFVTSTLEIKLTSNSKYIFRPPADPITYSIVEILPKSLKKNLRCGRCVSAKSLLNQC